jgi:hypothetical protein
MLALPEIIERYQLLNYFQVQCTVNTDLLQYRLGKGRLLDAISIGNYCCESAFSEATQLLRHNHVGDHCCCGLVIVNVSIIDSVFCNQPRDNVAVESCHCIVTPETVKRVRCEGRLVTERWWSGRVGW